MISMTCKNLLDNMIFIINTWEISKFLTDHFSGKPFNVIVNFQNVNKIYV